MNRRAAAEVPSDPSGAASDDGAPPNVCIATDEPGRSLADRLESAYAQAGSATRLHGVETWPVADALVGLLATAARDADIVVVVAGRQSGRWRWVVKEIGMQRTVWLPVGRPSFWAVAAEGAPRSSSDPLAPAWLVVRTDDADVTRFVHATLGGVEGLGARQQDPVRQRSRGWSAPRIPALRLDS